MKTFFWRPKMLEHAQLAIDDWKWATPDEQPGLGQASWVRPIRRIVDGLALGFVQATSVRRWPWLSHQSLEVLETEDASLEMTLIHRWLGFGRWHVLDAEERRLGSVLLPHLLNAEGNRFASLHAGATSDRRVLQLSSGELAAEIATPSDRALQVKFAAGVDANPFLRMLLLAAALALNPRPPVRICKPSRVSDRV